MIHVLYMYVVVCRTNMRMFGLYCMNEKRIISLSIRKKKHIESLLKRFYFIVPSN